MLYASKQILEWSLLGGHGWRVVVYLWLRVLVDIWSIENLSVSLERGLLLLLLLLLLLHTELLLLHIGLSSNGEGLKVSWLLGANQVALQRKGNRLWYWMVRIYNLRCLQRHLMGDLCRSLLVNNILLSSQLLRRLINLLIYLLSSHLFRWLLHNHATKIHVLIIQHLEFNVVWRNFAWHLVIAVVLLMLSHLIDWLRAAINLCLNCLDLKLAVQRILQLNSFAYRSRWKSRFILLFGKLIAGPFGSRTSNNFLLNSHLGGWNLIPRILSPLSPHSLTENRTFRLFQILF